MMMLSAVILLQDASGATGGIDPQLAVVIGTVMSALSAWIGSWLARRGQTDAAALEAQPELIRSTREHWEAIVFGLRDEIARLRTELAETNREMEALRVRLGQQVMEMDTLQRQLAAARSSNP